MDINLRSYSAISTQHTHDFHQVVLPLEGRLSLEISHHIQRVGSTLAGFIHAGEKHAFESSGQNSFIVADLPAAQFPHLFNCPRFFTLDAPLKSYSHFLAQALPQTQHQTMLRQQAGQLLVELLSQHSSPIDARLQQVKRHIDQHYGKPLLLNDLARIAHLSPRQLSTRFQQCFHCTPMDYLLEKRMQVARALLENTMQPIALIGEQVGYPNAASFSRCFKQFYGVPPKAIRSICKENR